MGLFGLFGKKKKKEKEAPRNLTPTAKISANKELDVPAYDNNFVLQRNTDNKSPLLNTDTDTKRKSKSHSKNKKEKPLASAKEEPALLDNEQLTPPQAEQEELKGALFLRSGKFEIKKTKDDRYVFNLYASNNVIVATSQVYSSPSSAITGIKSVINNAEKAAVEVQTLKDFPTLPYPKWEIYKDNGDQYRFRLSASNGSCICHSQGYTKKSNCKNGIESIRKFAPTARIEKAYIKKQSDT